jgi:hypothetical protein
MRYRARTAVGRRLQDDRRFRIVTGAAATLAVNLLYGTGHAVLGLMDGSVWLLVMAAYCILLGMMRFGAVLTEYKHASEHFVMRFCGGMLMALALVMGAATVISLIQERAVPHGIVIMLIIALYTFWKMTMAIVHTVQAHQSGTPLTRTIRNITLASAFASLMTMQRSMLVSFQGEATAQEMMILNICTGTAVCLLVFLMGLNMVFEERGFEKMAKSKLVKANQKIAQTVVEGYKKVEDAVVGGYKKVEGGVVGGYRKIEDKFVDQFLTRDGETVEEAKARLKAENKTEK